MDWKTAGTAFAALFLAEMGDKTQLAAFTMAASTGKPWAVFLGGAAALAAVTGIGVALGHSAGSFLPETLVRRTAAVLFIGIGVVMLVKG